MTSLNCAVSASQESWSSNLETMDHIEYHVIIYS